MKRVFEAGELPQGMQAELNATMRAMEKKYGRKAVEMGTHIANLSTVVCMIDGAAKMSDVNRAAGAAMAGKIVSDIICTLGRALDVDSDGAFAVARALRDYSDHANDEILAAEGVSMPAAITAEAAAVLAKAARAA